MPDLPKPVQTPSTDATELALLDLEDRARGYVEASMSASTRRAYAAAWKIFCAWCHEHVLSPLPADAETLAAYLTDRAPHLLPGTLTKHVVAIAQVHRLRGLHDPTLDARIKRLMRGIRRTHGQPARGKAPLLVGDLISIVETLDLETLAGLRDKALLLVGFAAALRRSEIVALDVEDLDFRSDGIALMLRRSKTDQEGNGRVVGVAYGTNGTCPVVALRSWLTTAGISTGPVFRAVDRHDRVRDGRLNAKTVCRIIKKLVPAAGLNPAAYGGHSLRSGFATSAAAAGIEERDIAAVTGHRSLQVLRSYIREGNLFAAATTTRVGL